MYDLFIFLGWERYRTHQECCKTMIGSRLSPPESTLSRRTVKGVTSSGPMTSRFLIQPEPTMDYIFLRTVLGPRIDVCGGWTVKVVLGIDCFEIPAFV